MKNGDYLPDARGGLRYAEDTDALLQRVLWKLTVRRGSFPFLPTLGSRLYTLPRSRASEWSDLARLYAAQALETEEGLTVTGAEILPGEGGAQVRVTMKYQGTELAVTAPLEG